jgi:hypothetical protein
MGSMALPILFVAFIFVASRRNERLSRDTAYAGRVRANAIAHKAVKSLKGKLKGGQVSFYEALFGTLQGYLGNRLHVPAGGITYDEVEMMLKPKEADLQMLHKMRDLFNVCDRARFAGLSVDETRMKDDIKELEEVIKYLERAKL